MKKIFDCRGQRELDQFDFGVHDQGLPSCTVSSSLFCVLDEGDAEKKAKRIEGGFSLDHVDHKYKWPNVFGEGRAANDRSFYQFGDPILVYNEVTEEMENFSKFYM